MAERDDVGREQITAVCRRVDELEHEINREYGVRWRLHKIENTLTAHALLMKLACAVSGVIGTAVGGVAVALLK